MVALFVLATIIAFVLVDVFVQRSRRARQAEAASPAHLPVADRFLIPRGYFLSKGHSWIEVLFSGNARIGLDDFVQKLVGPVDGVSLTAVGQAVRKDEPLFSIRQGDRTLSFLSPLSGIVRELNTELSRNPALLNADPYGAGWIAVVEPTNLAAELPSTSIAEAAAVWLKKEIARFRDFVQQFGHANADALPAGVTLLDGGFPVVGVLGKADEQTWLRFEREFLVSRKD